LFAGIGGFELGLSAAGHHTRLLCEIDNAACAVLTSRFPGVACVPDVRELERLPEDSDLLVGGFPCQDLSQAGRTEGINGDASGVVREVFRLLNNKRHRPRWVLLENVSFMLKLGKGRALEVILGELERLGYRWAYRTVNSLAFGVPQRRERVYLLASLDADPRTVLFADEAGEPAALKPDPSLAFGFYWTEGNRGLGTAVDAVPTLKGGSTVGIPSPPAVLMPDGRVVTPSIRDAERLQGFPADWSEPAVLVARSSRRWKLVGNAITVPIAEWIGRRLSDPGRYDDTLDPLHIVSGSWPAAAWNLGYGRHRAENVSAWPLAIPRPSLHEFLREPAPLSVKATAGFLSRLRASRLRRPDWFDKALAAHLAAEIKAIGASSTGSRERPPRKRASPVA
ncbi:MAG: DNA cytosine methyltransferase, partial [Candidatus Binatia bacterium]